MSFQLLPENTSLRRRLNTVDLLIKVACFVIKKILFVIPNAADLNKLVEVSKFYYAFPDMGIERVVNQQ